VRSSDHRRSRSDWEKVDRLSDSDIAADAASDADAAPLLDDEWFGKARVRIPEKQPISIRVDADVLDFFRMSGARYQTKINAVLRAYMEAVTKERSGGLP
jgi:uncharacterized protein (DUF4415 family)